MGNLSCFIIIIIIIDHLCRNSVMNFSTMFQNWLWKHQIEIWVNDFPETNLIHELLYNAWPILEEEPKLAWFNVDISINYSTLIIYICWRFKKTSYFYFHSLFHYLITIYFLFLKICMQKQTELKVSYTLFKHKIVN